MPEKEETGQMLIRYPMMPFHASKAVFCSEMAAFLKLGARRTSATIQTETSSLSPGQEPTAT